MSDEKMRQEFEAWAKAEGYSLRKYTQAEFEAFAKADGLDVLRWLDFSSSYIDSETTAAEHGYEAGYQAGRKAEREAIQLKNWDGIRLGTTNKPEGER